MNKLYVALGLFKMLSENREIGTTMVAKEFEVSKRTAQRYLSEIAYLPFIHFDEERYTYSLIDKSVFNGTILKGAELSFLTAVFGYTKTILGNNNAEMIDKISKKIFHANYTNSTHHMINIASVDYEKIADAHIKLERHIQEEDEITFKYSRYDKTYRVYPYKIIFHGGFWYLAAENGGVLKKYVLEYISDIKPTGKSCPKPSEKMTETLANAKSIWFEDGEKTVVTIKITGFITDYFKRRPFLDEQINTENDDGSMTVTFKAVNEHEMFQLLSPWIEYIEVVEPASFREFVCRAGKQISKNNSPRRQP